MKKDDYFVIAYQILSYLYECLKAGVDADVRKINEKKFNINERYWNWIMKALYRSDRIEGVMEVAGRNDIKIGALEITEEGIIFLQENSNMEKAKNFLKEIKAIVPGF